MRNAHQYILMYHQIEVAIFLSFRKNKEIKCISVQISNHFKGPSFHCQKFVDQKYL